MIIRHPPVVGGPTSAPAPEFAEVVSGRLHQPRAGRIEGMDAAGIDRFLPGLRAGASSGGSW